MIVAAVTSISIRTPSGLRQDYSHRQSQVQSQEAMNEAWDPESTPGLGSRQYRTHERRTSEDINRFYNRCRCHERVSQLTWIVVLGNMGFRYPAILILAESTTVS